MNKYYAELEINSNLYPISINAISLIDAESKLHSDYKFDRINYIADKHIKYGKDKVGNSATTPHISHFSGNKTSKSYAGMEV